MTIPTFKTLAEACRYSGIIAPDYVPSFGESLRVRTEKHPRNKNGFLYGLADNAVFVANWEDWEGLKSVYSDKADRKFTPQELVSLKKATQTLREEREKESAKAQWQVAIHAQEFIRTQCKSLDTTRLHSYLLGKQIQPVPTILETTGEQFNQTLGRDVCQRLKEGRYLVIPLVQSFHGNKKVVSIQFIDEYGGKFFLKGGRTKGSYWLATNRLNSSQSKPLIVMAEGVATLLSVIQRQPFNGLAVAGMNCNNLEKVALSLHYQYPNLPMLILADNDKSGAGIKGAEKARKAVKYCFIKMPQFSAEDIEAFKSITGTDKEPTDWNEYYKIKSRRFK